LKKLITLLFLFAFAGLTTLLPSVLLPSVRADSAQGLTWTNENTVNFTAQSPGGPYTTPGNTSVDAVGASLIDVSGNNWGRYSVTGPGTILYCPDNNPGASYGQNGLLLRPAGVSSLNQRVIVKNYMNAANALCVINLRVNVLANQSYSLIFRQTNATGVVWNNYPTNYLVPIAGLPTGTYSASIPVGDYYITDASVVSSGGASTIAVTVTDTGTNPAASTGTVIYTATSSPDTTSFLQGVGQAGLGGNQSAFYVLTMQTLNSGTAVPPVLTAGLPVLVSAAPAVGVIGSSGASGGTGPYTAALYRSATPLFTPPAGVLVGTQSGLASGVSPANITDTGGAGIQWYKWLFTDAASATYVGSALPVSYPDRTLAALILGDSRAQGAAGDVTFLQWATAATASSGGTGYTSPPPITVTNPSGFTGRTAVFQSLLDGAGHVLGAYPTDRGYGYTNIVGGPTLTVGAGGGGSGATFAAPASNTSNNGGGNVLVAEQILRSLGGSYHSVTLWDGAVNGTFSASFVPGNQYLTLALAQAGPASQTPWVVYALGVNDAGSLVPRATFKANALATCQSLVSGGRKVLLVPPFFAIGRTDTQNDLRLQYQQALVEIAATDPQHIIVGKVTEDPAYTAAPALLMGDGLHSNDIGHAVSGGILADGLANAFGLSSAAVLPLTLTATAGVNSEVLTWTPDNGATNGYEVDWKPSSVLPVAGQVKSVVAIVGTGVLTWTDTSTYRLSQNGRYNIVGLH